MPHHDSIVPGTLGETRIAPEGWDAALADTEGPQLIVAGPGAGKTEFLVRRAALLIERSRAAPDEIVILSFSRRSAADLRRRIVARLGRSLTSLQVGTFHSLALRLLEAFAPDAFGWQKAPSLLTGPEQIALVTELLAAEDPAAWPKPFREILASAPMAAEVGDFVLRCGEHLIDPPALEELALDRADWRALPGFLARYLAELGRRGRIDYGNLQAAAVRLFTHKDLAEADTGRYVLVDEYQDTTRAQAALLSGLVGRHRNITAAGDPYQSIYSFRGAALANVADFPYRFRDESGTPARRVVLTTSFRVPAAILEAAVRATSGGDLPGAAGPVEPAPGRGSVEAYRFDQRTHEAEWIAGELERIHLRDSIPYRHMAVLVRSKRGLLSELSRSLARRGIRHDEPDARLVSHPSVQPVLDCVRAAAGDPAERDAAARRLLLGPIGGLTLAGMRALERRRAATAASWSQLVAEAVDDGGRLAGLIDDARWATSAPAQEGFWALWSALPWFAAGVRARRAADLAAWSSLAQVLGRLRERDPDATLADYAAWSQSEDFEAEPLLEFRPQAEDRLTLTTLHQAKGAEFDIVVIADAVEGTFPDLRRRESLLGVRHLSATQPLDPVGYSRFRLQEEMRLAYTAMCRASTRVIWTCTEGVGDTERTTPSRFLSLIAADGPMRPEQHGEPTTPLEAEAWLRRRAADPRLGESVRLASLGALVGPGSWRRRDPSAFAGVLQRGPDTGLVPRDLPLSPTQAETYQRCGRRYAIERRLGVDGGGSVYLAFGNLVHNVLEAAEGAAIIAGDPHATLTDALALLDAEFEPSAFGGTPWADSWHRRATRVITHLYEEWPSGTEARSIGVEHSLEAEIAGRRWRGRIDLIEYDAAGLRLVDHKTTAGNIPTKADAATSIQLGFYAIAAAGDPSLLAIGTIAAAELWFPATKSVSVTTRSLDLDRLDEVTALLADAAEGIAKERWDPRIGKHCDRCPVRIVCDRWPEGREAYAS